MVIDLPLLLSALLAGAPAPLPFIGESLDPPGTRAGFPDPKVYPRDGWYYITGTGTRLARTRGLAPDDLELFDLNLDFGPEAERGARQVWGFSLYWHTDGTVHAYATIHYGDFRTVIGHFLPAEGQQWTPDRPITSWRLDRVLIGDVTRGWIAYDQAVYRDEDGSLYLVYNSGAPDEVLGVDIHVKVRRMLDPATLDPGFAPRTLLGPDGLRSEDRNYPGGIQIVESVVIQRLAGRYCLLYSVGDFDDANYKIGVAYSDSLLPPEGETYRKVLVPDPDDVWGNGRGGEEVLYLLQTQHTDWPNYAGEILNGPGIGSVVELPSGERTLVFHARMPGVTRLGGRGRYTWCLPVEVDIRDDRPMSEWIRVPLPE